MVTYTRILSGCIAVALVVCFYSTSFGQTYGVELHNSLMPASSGMGGASFSQPQDLQSAIYANPATTTQFEGTQFSFGGGWAEPTVNLEQATSLPLIGVDPFQAKSQTPGSLVGNIGVLHDIYVQGRPVKLGLGFMTNAGLGVDYRQVPESNGTHLSLLALDTVASAATQLTDRLSIGASIQIGTGIMDGPFVGASSSQIDYAARGNIGLNYEMQPGVSFGAYYQSEKSHTFDDLVRFPGQNFQSLNVDLPRNVGFGIANRNLMNGRLLVAADAIFKRYSTAETFGSIFDDQWAFQFGTQYIATCRVRLRAGYAYNENPNRDTVPGTIGGVIPIGGIPAVQYIQSQVAAISQHRLTGGVGISDITPGVDLDLSLGGMFGAEQSFGNATASVESYWLAFGFTWKCGQQNCCGQTACDCGPATHNLSDTTYSESVSN